MERILKYCLNASTWNLEQDDYAFFLSTISRPESSRIDRLLRRKDCKLSLAGHLLARLAIKELTGIDWLQIEILRDEQDRPYLRLSSDVSSGFGVDFNISHSGDYTILAAVRFSQESNFRIGCDVMVVPGLDASSEKVADEFTRLLPILNNEFSEREKAYVLSQVNVRGRLLAFYRVWCLKESFIKAIGVGLSIGLKRIDFIIKSELKADTNMAVDDSEIILDSIKIRNYKFYEQLYSSEGSQIHIMTICVDCKCGDWSGMSLCNELSQSFYEIDQSELRLAAASLDLKSISNPHLEHLAEKFKKKF